MKTRNFSSRNPAFTLVEVMVVVTILGLLIGIAVPKIMMARDASRLRVIQTNLRQIEEAKHQWAFEQGQRDGAPVADVSVLQEYLRGGTVHEVIQETYLPNPVGISPTATLPGGVKLGPYAAGAVIPAP
jgi:prepilin-type N-terminal cleavage/methylation domain-containing protein